MLELGIIGTGRVAKEHARGAADAGSRIACIYDTDHEKATCFAQEHGGSMDVAGSLDDLLNRADIPAVVIAVPNAMHKDAAIACLNADKHVLLEKPMAMNTAECDAIINAMRGRGRRLQMGFVCRSAPRVQCVRELIEAGTLGTIYHVKASLYRRRGIPGLGRWFTTKAMSGGGVVIDLGVHFIDLIKHLTGAKRARTVSAACESRFGSPIAEYAFTEMWAGPPELDGTFDVEDYCCAFIRLDNGVSFELNLSWAANLPERTMPEGVLLLGDRGGCFFDLWGEQFTVTTQVDGLLVDTPLAMDNSDAWQIAWRVQHERFADTVLRAAQPVASSADGRAVQEIVDALYESSRSGREVALA